MRSRIWLGIFIGSTIGGSYQNCGMEICTKAGMSDTTESDRNFLQAIHRERAQIVEQIRQSQHAIERSQALLERIDEMLARKSLPKAVEAASSA